MIKDEWSIIDTIASVVGDSSNQTDLIKGIGDDCAVYDNGDGTFGLFSTDMAVEDIHFSLDYCSGTDIGHKIMAANISDILSMAGTPILALVSIGIPPDSETSFIKEIYTGIKGCADIFNTIIAGGDTTSSEKLIINISIYGRADKPVYRTGAKPGDSIYLTKWEGSSRLGLEVLTGAKNIKGNPVDARDFPLSVERHLRPTPPSTSVKEILETYKPSAMIDVSDGIVSELNHICAGENLGFRLEKKLLPISDEIINYCSVTGNNQIDYILNSGEEYGLLFTGPGRLENTEEIIKIGEITESKYILHEDSIETEIINGGYNHFKG